MNSRSRLPWLAVAVLALALAPRAVDAAPESPPLPVAYRTDVSIFPLTAAPGVYLARFEFRNPHTDQRVVAAHLVVRAGEPAERELLTFRPFLVRARVTIDPGGGEAVYSSELLEGVTLLAAQSASIRLPQQGSR